MKNSVDHHLIDKDQQTIAAIATPAGYGGISVIRVSGPQALEITRRHCVFLPASPESHKIYYGFFKNSIQSDSKSLNTKIDEVLVSWFDGGKSFTGEPCAEISCHGSPQICDSILKCLVASGARIAGRGEFTFRAFMNDRLDLIQAESVLSLIQSTSESASRVALRQLQGELSVQLIKIIDELTWCLAHIEAAIDFSTENLEVVSNEILLSKTQGACNSIKRLLDSFSIGKKLKEGLQIALIGRPNVGKSSLLNRLLGQDKAIVTSAPGTTRDVVEGDVQLDGHRLSFFDTAGIRETIDLIESIGIKKTQKKITECDHLFFVLDAHELFQHKDNKEYIESIANELPILSKGQKLTIVLNKIDQLSELQKDFLQAHLPKMAFSVKIAHLGLIVSSIFVSALDPDSKDRLLLFLKENLISNEANESVVLTNARHAEGLQQALVFAETAYNGLKNGSGEEYIAFDLKEALLSVQKLLGIAYDDQILDRVFKEFCIGK